MCFNLYYYISEGVDSRFVIINNYNNVRIIVFMKSDVEI